MADIKHRKPSSFSSQPLPVYNQPFHVSSRVGEYNPLLVYASNMNRHHWSPAAGCWHRNGAAHCGKRTGNAQRLSVTSNAKPIWPAFSSTVRCTFLHRPWFYRTHSATITLRNFKLHRLRHWFHVCVVPKNIFQIITDFITIIIIIVINYNLKYTNK
jgi:hypothetical protein